MNVLRVGRYRMLQRLGEGATAEVYLAEDTVLQRKVAVKIMRRRNAGPDEVRKFQAEARCTAMLNHPNIVTVFDVGTEGGVEFIATEFVEGETLRQRMMRGPVPLHHVVKIGVEVGRALVAAHEAWIVHRDVKPENIMLRRDGGIKVLDFSIARLIGGGESTDPLRRPGGFAGTLAYLSPEQVRGEPIIDTRSDIYSLGVVLYEMLAERPPFEGPLLDVLAAIVEQDAPPLPPTVPLALHHIVGRAIRRDLYQRHQTSAELLRELEEFQLELMIRSRSRHAD